MRIKLKRGKQKELLTLAKGRLTWNLLGGKINLSEHYLGNELNNEKRLLDEKVYRELCNLASTNFDNFIEEKLENDWGRSKGGTNSKGNTKLFVKPKENEKLAELFGIILGDGHLEILKIGKKIRCYSLNIAGHIKEDREYLLNYVNNLIEHIFKEKAHIKLSPKDNCVHVVIHGKNLTKFIQSKGIYPGNKKKNNQGIPDWIKGNKKFLKKCIRGLIDTDGSIHCISKNNKNLRICFTSYIPKLIDDTRNSLISLGFHPSKIIKGNQIFLSRKEEIEKYIQEINFKNKKHLNRYKRLKF